MATLRKGKCYRFIERPYTRKSKFKKKGYIKSVPPLKVVSFGMGDPKKDYTNKVRLVSTLPHQIRHNAIESARQLVNRSLTEKIPSGAYNFIITMYPHHLLRENKMLGGAHADRLQSGMAHSFGKTVGSAAQVKVGKTVFMVKVNKENIDHARSSLKKATPRLPGTYTILIE
ncbi:MAG TPA: 50S ribosomal protein L16 [Candidatus Nanoarchaeia archaeon]|nr:50S ribosomal protein L16 [Candidatus Nanoarchaeia archaeon]